MRLRLSDAEIAFRDEVRNFLTENLSDDLKNATMSAKGTFGDFDAMMKWHRLLFDKGWIAPNWPSEYGGTGWSASQHYIFETECGDAHAPKVSAFGLQMCGPVIMHFGTPEQKAYYLPKILSGEHLWCQGYSEPNSGSDLASLQTAAVLDGEDYIVNGTKMWTTLAHQATHMFCLVRTSSAGKPQSGITFLLLEMNTPGMTVRPILNIACEHEFNQVFFDNVRVPRHQILGAEGAGWSVAKSLLEFERGGNYAAALNSRLDWVRSLARERIYSDAHFLSKLAQLEIAASAVEMQENRVLSALETGQPPGRLASILKLQGSELLQRIDELAIELVGLEATTNDADLSFGRYFYDRSVTVFGGTSEIQRNIIARTIL
jgi:alkylation response protein AidB-like acyl-CoA dehydrogenase